MPLYDAGHVADELDLGFFLASSAVVVALLVSVAAQILRGQAEIRRWPYGTQTFKKECEVQQVVFSADGAITSNHSPQQAGRVVCAVESGNPLQAASAKVAGSDSNDQDPQVGSGSEDDATSGTNGVDVGLTAFIAASRFLRLRQAYAGQRSMVAETFKGVKVDLLQPTVRQQFFQVLLGVPHMVGLPSLIISHLGERLGFNDDWVSWVGGGSLVTSLAVAAVVLPAHVCPLGPLYALISLGVWFGFLAGTIVLFIAKTHNDSEWTHIHDFMNHRRFQLNGGNCLALAAQIAALLQLIALAVRVLPDPVAQLLVHSDSAASAAATANPYEMLSSYDRFKVGLKMLGDYTLMKLDLVFNFEVSFLLSVYAVLLFGIVFGGFMIRITTHVTERALDVETASHHIQQRYLLYKQMAGTPGNLLYTLFTVLSDAALLAIVGNLVSPLDCTYAHYSSDDATDDAYSYARNTSSTQHNLLREVGFLDAKTEWKCWSTENRQLAYASVALTCLVFYIPCSVLLAPFITADSDGIFQPETLDVRFTARFQLMERSAKMLICVVSEFFGLHHPRTVLVFQIVMFMLLLYNSAIHKPCSITWVNSWRSGVFGISATGSMAVLLDVNTHLEWWPVVMFMVMCIGIVSWMARDIKAHAENTAELHLLFAAGNERRNTTSFNDAASLRGHNHRMLALHVVVGKRQELDDGATQQESSTLVGLRVTYEMDGYAVECPNHEGSLRHSKGLTLQKERMFLCRDETIVLFALYFLRNQRSRQTDASAVALRVWTASAGTLNPTPREFGVRPPVGRYTVEFPELARLGLGEIVAFHGSIGMGLNTLGAVIQHSEQYAWSKTLLAGIAAVVHLETEQGTVRHRTQSQLRLLEEGRVESRAVWEVKLHQERQGRADQAMVPGTRIWVQGYGWGTYKQFKKKTWGANEHVVQFDQMEATEETLGESSGRELTLVLRKLVWDVMQEEDE